MLALVDFFKSLWDTIVGIVDLVISFFQDIGYVIKLTGKFLASLPSYFSWLPGELVVFIIMIFTVVVIYKVIGREG